MDFLSDQYLKRDVLLNNIKYDKINVDDLISADSYNEKMIVDKFNSFPDDVRSLLLKCAIHIAIIGAGNKSYGMIRSKDNEILKIEDIFTKYGIVYNKNIGEKYNKDTLSARRLVRLLRYHIQQFIIDTNRPSYLWIKYADNDKSKISVCFPGAEHLIENTGDAEYLIKAYNNLDKVIGTKFEIRLRRVYIARKIFPPEYFLK
jgi:hypothetical protein